MITFAHHCPYCGTENTAFEVAKGLLVKSMGDFAHRIRVLGNVATHDELTLGELEELRTFIQLFLQYTFTLPAMIPEQK